MRLTKKVETYRCETENEAEELVASKKAESNGYEVTKSSITMKTKKSKGEIIEVFYIASVEMNYDIQQPNNTQENN